jgi:hypothetical protein
MTLSTVNYSYCRNRLSAGERGRGGYRGFIDKEETQKEILKQGRQAVKIEEKRWKLIRKEN